MKEIIEAIKNWENYELWLDDPTLVVAIRGDQVSFKVGERIPESKSLDFDGWDEIEYGSDEWESLESVGGTCGFKIDPKAFLENPEEEIEACYDQATDFGYDIHVIVGWNYGRKRDIGPVAENEIIVNSAKVIYAE